MFLIGLFVFTKCQNDSGFRVEHSARMGWGLNAGDTTKPKPVNHNYVLQGDDVKFNLLWTFLNSPIDVTPRQLDSLKYWIQKNLKQDTTIKR
jgi:hypothetical protein